MKARKLVFTLVAATAIAGGSMIAFAAWTANGSGSGEAKAALAEALEVDAVTPAGCLYPGATGSTACPVKFTVTNPNDYPVSIDKLTLGAIEAVSGGLDDGCDDPSDTHGVTVNTAQQTITAFTVAANSTSAEQTSPLLVSMNNTSHNDCQGATFTIAATVVGASAAA